MKFNREVLVTRIPLQTRSLFVTIQISFESYDEEIVLSKRLERKYLLSSEIG